MGNMGANARTPALAGIIVVTIGLVLGSAVAPATAQVTRTAPAVPVSARAAALSTSSFESQVLSLINTRRKKIGCKALTTSKALRLAARRHSNLMVKTKNLSHQLPGESGLAKRIVKAGYTRWTTLGENIAWGPKSPTQIYTMWMNSSGHRANIQKCAYRNGGVGVRYSGKNAWVTLDLGARR
ncbi:MAG: hypothetical protein JWQ74_1640 [Marmoricola sp.]|nr:hypothetical protein [Marmoricola sp.]